MNMLLDNVAALSTDPKAWAVAALVVLKALISVFMCFRCPVVRGTHDITDAMIEEGRAYRIEPKASYLAVMLGGMALTVIGLYMLSDTSFGPLALGAVVIGMFMFMTEPSRFFVHVARMGVFATTGGEEEPNALARDRLRSAHWERAMFEAIIAAIVVAILLWL